MKRLLSISAACLLGGALSAGGVTTNAAAGRGVAPPAAAVAPVKAPLDEAAVRRTELNARLREMVRSGQGGRLRDPEVVRRPRAVARRADAQRAPKRPPASAPSGPARLETSTIAPPPVNAAAARINTSRGYRPPRLDLLTPPNIPASDIECLTQAIYYEARNESEEGQAAVAEVVINRSRAGGYPKKVCDVVYQRNSRTCQFTFTCDGSIGRGAVNMRAWGRAERIAREVYEGRSRALLPSASVNYHASYVKPSWGRRLQRVRRIGAHIFYGAPLGGHVTPGAEPGDRTPVAPRGLVWAPIAALDRAYSALSGQTASSSTAP